MLERKENIILLKTDAFGDRIVKLYNYLRAEKQEFVMSKQILRSGTSIGALLLKKLMKRSIGLGRLYHW